MRRYPLTRSLLALSKGPAPAVTIAEVLAGFGLAQWALPVLVFGAAGMVPSPGLPLGMVCGAILMLYGILSLTGGGLPRMVTQWQVKRPWLRAAARTLTPGLRAIERRLKPSWPVLASPPRLLLSAVVIAMGFLIWLPIPFGNLPPGLALGIMALGLIAGDGRAVAVGLVLAALSAGLGIALFDVAVSALARLA